MLSNTLFVCASQVPKDLAPSEFRERPQETAVLLATPEFFRVEGAINPHMVDRGGQLNVVDQPRARGQWREIVAVLEDLGLKVHVIPGREGLPDMVFTANQSFPFVDAEGAKKVLLSRMRTKERQGELQYFADWYAKHGFAAIDFDMARDEALEGMGDLLWLPDRYLIFAGVGPRTDRSVVERLPDVLGCPIFALELTNPRFYHLDTAFVPLDQNRALVHPPAFSRESLSLLDSVFDELLVAPREECESGFACNALVLPGQHVLIDDSCVKTGELLGNLGYEIHFVSTSEFRKSGGSVFCMTMMLP